MENIITESGPFVGSAKLVPMDEVFVVRSPGGGEVISSSAPNAEAVPSIRFTPRALQPKAGVGIAGCGLAWPGALVPETPWFKASPWFEASPSDEVGLLRLRRQVAKLRAVLQEKNKQLRILQDRTADLYRELIALRASR
jgi:hypothetical protein